MTAHGGSLVAECDGPSITLIVRQASSEVFVTCVEYPEWDSRGETLAATVDEIADRAQGALRAPFDREPWGPVVEISHDTLPPLAIIRVMWSWASFSYIATLDELPDLRALASLAHSGRRRSS